MYRFKIKQFNDVSFSNCLQVDFFWGSYIHKEKERERDYQQEEINLKCHLELSQVPKYIFKI